jgi:hypothetical protein
MNLRRGSMLNSGNNDWEQNWLLLSPRVKRAESDWQETVILGCPRWNLKAYGGNILQLRALLTTPH